MTKRTGQRKGIPKRFDIDDAGNRKWSWNWFKGLGGIGGGIAGVGAVTTGIGLTMMLTTLSAGIQGAVYGGTAAAQIAGAAGLTAMGFANVVTGGITLMVAGTVIAGVGTGIYAYQRNKWYRFKDALKKKNAEDAKGAKNGMPTKKLHSQCDALKAAWEKAYQQEKVWMELLADARELQEKMASLEKEKAEIESKGLGVFRSLFSTKAERIKTLEDEISKLQIDCGTLQTKVRDYWAKIHGEQSKFADKCDLAALIGKLENQFWETRYREGRLYQVLMKAFHQWENGKIQNVSFPKQIPGPGGNFLYNLNIGPNDYYAYQSQEVNNDNWKECCQDLDKQIAQGQFEFENNPVTIPCTSTKLDEHSKQLQINDIDTQSVPVELPVNPINQINQVNPQVKQVNQI